MIDVGCGLGERNWGGNVAYRASRVVRPGSLAELSDLIDREARLSVVATRHTFNEIGDADLLVDLRDLTRPPVVHPDGTVTATGTTSYTDLAMALDAAGRALPNLASLPHISVAGAVATGTHGSGVGNGSLATSVESIDLMTGSGDVATFASGDDDFDGVVVHLGTLGIVTSLTLRTEPAYDVAQTVADGLTWEVLTDRFDDVAESATSVSVFTRYGDTPGELWRKQRTDRPAPGAAGSPTFSTSPAATARHPLPGEDAAACTEQFGVPGPWWTRLSHFRHDAVPSSGAEIQSEWFVDRRDSAAAIDALRAVASSIDDVLMVSEIRTVAADRHWMSPSTGRASTAFHFTWKLDPSAVASAVDAVDRTLAPFGARAHWGKVLPDRIRARGSYERLDDFLALKSRLDPQGAFTTPWFERHVAS